MNANPQSKRELPVQVSNGQLDALAPRGVVRHLRVLVVDDHSPNRLLVARILEKRGHAVLQAGCGTEALQIIAREPVHVVLMDAQMPGMDGLEATARIRASERQTALHLPIIAITAATTVHDCERCLQAGMDACHAKPINAGELVRLVETLGAEALGVEAAEGQSEGPPAASDPPAEFAAALARLEGDQEILGEQMKSFLDQGPMLLARIRAAIAADEPAALQLFAHRLKGCAASLDGHAVVAAAEQLEQLGRDRQVGSASTHCDQLNQALDAFQATVRRYLAAVAP